MPSTSTTANPQLTSIQQVSDFEAADDNGEIRVVQNTGRFHIVGVSSDHHIHVYESNSIPNYIRNGVGDYRKLNPWTKSQLERDPIGGDLQFLTEKRLGVLVIGVATLVFWVDRGNNTLCATRFTAGETHRINDWCQILAISNPGNTNPVEEPVQIAANGISATASLTDGIITVSYLVSIGSTLQVCQINLAYSDYNENTNLWRAASAPWYLPIPANVSPSANNLGTSDIRCISVSIPRPNDLSRASFQLGAIWDEHNHNIITLAWPLSSDGTAPLSTTPTVTTLQWPGSHPKRKADGMTLAIDPAGRLFASFGDVNSDGDITVALIPDLSPLIGNPSAVLTWTEHTSQFQSDETSDNEDTEGPMSVAFCLSDRPNIPVQQPATFPFVMALFWIRSSIWHDPNVMTTSMHYLDVQIVSEIAQPEAPYNRNRYVTSISDPFPLPQPASTNWNNSTPDGMADWLLFEYAFLTGNSHTHTVETTLKGGITVEGKLSLPWGSGGYIGGSVGGGMSWDKSSFTSIYTSQGMKVQSKAYFNPLSTDTDNSVPFALRPYGVYQGRSMFSVRRVTYTTLNMVFTAAGAATSADFPAYTVVADASNNDVIVGDFFTYAVTPGDVLSYSSSAINARMQDLFTRATQNMDQDRINELFTDYDKDGNPIDLTQIYKSGKYLEYVIALYGQKMIRDPFHGEHYVPFALSGSSVSDGSYVFRKGVSEGFGFYLDVSVYGGWSNESGPQPGTGTAPEDGLPQPAEEVPSLEEDDGYDGDSEGSDGDSSDGDGSDDDGSDHESASTSSTTTRSEAQVTVEVHFTQVTTDSDESTNAISMATYYNPLSPTQSLTARLYRFKPAKIWATELLLFPELARADYIAMLQQKVSSDDDSNTSATNNAGDSSTSSFPTQQQIADNADLKNVISNQSSLLIQSSLPSRTMLVVTNWDDAGYTIPSEYAITAPTPSTNNNPSHGTRNAPDTPEYVADNTGAAGAIGSSDANYTVAGQPAYIVQTLNTWVTPPAGTQWISFSADRQGNVQIYQYQTQITVNTSDLSSLAITGLCAADDSCTISVNGNVVPNPWLDATANYHHTVQFSIPGSYFNTGNNTVIFNVNNSGGGPTGLLVAFDINNT